jgi:hypothetical protein
MVKANSIEELKSATQGSDCEVNVKGEQNGSQADSSSSSGSGSTKQTERKHQKHLATWIDTVVDVQWTHTPNELWGSTPYQGKVRKDCGTKPGVPDVMIYDQPPGTDYRGVAIELKRPDGVPSDVTESQQEWLDALDERGWYTEVAYGSDEAVEILEELYNA